MSESGIQSGGLGLQKLTEYLNQTRRQADLAIDTLNDKISEMQEENETCLDMIEKLEKERDYYKVRIAFLTARIALDCLYLWP
jgi:chromosome segregation ATPase